MTADDIQKEVVQIYLARQPRVLKSEYDWDIPTVDNVSETLLRHPAMFQQETFPGEPTQWMLDGDFNARLFRYPPSTVDDQDYWGRSYPGSANIGHALKWQLEQKGTPMTVVDLVDRVQFRFWWEPMVHDFEDCPIVPTAEQVEYVLRRDLDQMFDQTHEDPVKWTTKSLRMAWLWCE